MPRNILVIGATGYLGGVLARHFAGEDHRVSGSARTREAADKLAGAGIAPVLEAARAADVVAYAAQVAFHGCAGHSRARARR